MSLTRDLGAFVAGGGADGTSDEDRNVARTCFIDCIATVIAGSGEEATATALSALAPLPPGPCQLWFGATRTAASEAALPNGVAGHALDYDNVALRGHPGRPLAAAGLRVKFLDCLRYGKFAGDAAAFIERIPQEPQ